MDEEHAARQAGVAAYHPRMLHWSTKGEQDDLRLWGNQISDISALAGLTNLKWLGLRYNIIRDISVLEGLTSLKSLDLEHNDLDLSPGSDSMKTIQMLIDRGVDVGYLP